MSVNAHTLEKLEFGEVRELVASYCPSSLGKDLARRIEPSRSPEMIARWLRQIEELQEASGRIGFPPFGGVHDVRPLVKSALPPNTLEPADLATVAETLSATRELRRWLDRLDDRTPALVSLGKRIGDFGAIGDRISDAVDARGEIRDTASPRLATLRSRIANHKAQIGEVLDRLLRRGNITRWLQYASATFHNDRMVLPLKSEHRGRIPGIIHRSSDSGATLFVEPAEAVELNNAIIRLRMEEHDEISRILWDLTQIIHQNALAILETLTGLAILDLIVGKTKFAQAYRAVCPKISDGKTMDIAQARHPLLVKMQKDAEQAGDKSRFVVPIDVRLGDDYDMLVITGPNTGGKTVALKTAGLLSVMAQSGIPIPAERGAVMPVYDRILIDVGDEQSLQQSLSTFSAHMTNVLSILREATPKTLALIDELGAGTDPDEGAAIGRAIMDELLTLGCSAMVTTHLGALKAVAFTQQRMENACVEFDIQTLSPTYRLLIGEPGNSNAIAIARRLGMSKRLVAAAQANLSTAHKTFSKAIAGTLDSKRKAEEARREAHTAALAAEQLKQTYETKAKQLDGAREAFQRWMKRVTTLQPGDEVYVKKFEKNAKVVRLLLQKQAVLVSTGMLDMEVPLVEIAEAR